MSAEHKNNSQITVFGSNTGENGSTNISSHNDIIWGNTELGGVGDVGISNVGGIARSVSFSSSYSDIASVWAYANIVTNNHVINIDLLFVDMANKDFHLRTNSPCIDAGDPDSSFNDSQRPPALGKERNDVGTYGRTG